MVYLEFKRQKAWIKSLHQSPAIKIQRLFNTHQAKKRCKALRLVRGYPSQKEKYLKMMRQREADQKTKEFKTKLLKKYRVQYQFDKTSRMMALDAAALPSGTGTTSTTTDEEDFEDVEEAETKESGQFSLKQNSANQPVTLKSGQPMSRFAELRAKVDSKKNRLRGPRLHIFKSQAYAVAAPESNDALQDRD
jgi:hypothetical protein